MKVQLGILAMTLVAAGPAFAGPGSPLSGTYLPLDMPGCKVQYGEPLTEFEIVATADGIQSTKGALTFAAGSVTTAPPSGVFNEFVSRFDGSFSTDGTEFKVTKYLVDRLNPTNPTYEGDLIAKLNGDKLRIDNSLSQATTGQPGELSTCILQKLSR